MIALTEKQQRLAEITEMIHTASLVHDDVLDECNTRRGEQPALRVISHRTSDIVAMYIECLCHTYTFFALVMLLSLSVF
jgi:geranylgeranyl pyrophosphate synthase